MVVAIRVGSACTQSVSIAARHRPCKVGKFVELTKSLQQALDQPI